MQIAGEGCILMELAQDHPAVAVLVALIGLIIWGLKRILTRYDKHLEDASDWKRAVAVDLGKAAVEREDLRRDLDSYNEAFKELLNKIDESTSQSLLNTGRTVEAMETVKQEIATLRNFEHDTNIKLQDHLSRINILETQ